MRVEGFTSYVVPFRVIYEKPLAKDHSEPKKELPWSPWVGLGVLVQRLDHGFGGDEIVGGPKRVDRVMLAKNGASLA